MDAKPAPSSQRAAGGERDGAEERVERYGPLLLRRLRKDDGRQLIAYESAPPAPGAGEKHP